MMQAELFAPHELQFAGFMPGAQCDVAALVADLANGTGTMYCIGERVRLIAKHGEKWLCAIDMPRIWGHTWHKNGTKIWVHQRNLRPPRRQLGEE